MIRTACILIIFLLTLSCGFKPIYKLSEENNINKSYSVTILNNVSREIIEEINTNIIKENNEKFSALLTIEESVTPLIINTNGTVAKYKIEILIRYKLIEIKTNEEVSSGSARGFAQYDVGTSEINNEDTKKSMIKIATKNAVQLMVSKIQSSISQINDN
tara:strand:+ start:58 stop:537 length:480 start_codon:yes stop_codon:yes gene_type:complete